MNAKDTNSTAKAEKTTVKSPDEVVTFYARRATSFRNVYYAQGYTIRCRRGEMNNSNFVEVTDDELGMMKQKERSRRLSDMAVDFDNQRRTDAVKKAISGIL